MKIYQPAAVGKIQTHLITPGKDFPDVSDWFFDEHMEDGTTRRRPTLFKVVFINGVADVEKTLGKYMLDKKLAQRSPLFLPDGVAA